jgi:hypothetical protein
MSKYLSPMPNHNLNAIAWSSGGTINYSLGNVFTLNASNTGTLTESNKPTSGQEYWFRIYFTLGGGATFTKPSSWSKGDGMPTIAGDYVITGLTTDGGTSFWIAVL